MDLEEELKRFEDSQANDQQASVHAVRELTSANRDKENEKLNNMDFKTRLTLPEVSAHACLEWLNEVFTEKEMLGKELRIIHLTERMKRIRVSEEGKAREGIEKIFTKDKVEDSQRGFWERFTGMGRTP
jgi:hypothetical protein